MKVCRVLLVSRPRGVAQAENFAIEETELPPLAEGRDIASATPSCRSSPRCADGSQTGEITPLLSRSAQSCARLRSARWSNRTPPSFAPGETVMGWFGWQDYADAPPSAVVRRVTEADLPASLALGVLGINGVTALIGLETIGDPKPGETVLVSTAAGAVGSAVGQIAKILGCRTVGVAGGTDKTTLCRELFRYDATIDYRAPGLSEAIAAACPDGVNVYFDNTSGAISDAVWPQACGRRAGGDLRNRLDLVLGALADRAAARTPSPRQARASAGLCRFRLPGSLGNISGETCRLGARGKASLRGGHSRRDRSLS